MRRLKVYLNVLRTAGTGMRTGRQADRLFRYSILKALDSVGFFSILEKPRSYGELLVELSFTDNEYTQDLFNTLVNDPQNIIMINNDKYERNPEVPFPSQEELLKKTDPRIRPFITLGESIAPNIIDRLRGNHISFSDTFERDDSSQLHQFNTVLGNRVYTSMRSAAFSLLRSEERSWLTRKKLLDIGCGSGRETAEIWMRYKGDIYLTAIDPVRSMIDLACESFDQLLDEIDPNHPPLIEENAPTFEVGSATELPYEDNSFDAAFWMFVLQWTPNPERAISEAVRVVKPGGLFFGAQTCKPIANPYYDLLIRSNPNCYGNFWQEDYLQWFGAHGVEVEMATPAGMFRARNPVG